MLSCFLLFMFSFLQSNTEPESDKVTTLNRLHGLLLHLFIMLSNESGKMSSSVSYCVVTLLTFGKLGSTSLRLLACVIL